ncbi:MAG: DUF349 domain-containing protein [Bacteroidales bacterium]|nr:DUF349 domain-containing protein [Bacteroidales bacterium]
MENKEHTDQNPDLEQDPVQEENSSPVEIKETTTESTEIVPETTDSTEEKPSPPETTENETDTPVVPAEIPTAAEEKTSETVPEEVAVVEPQAIEEVLPIEEPTSPVPESEEKKDETESIVEDEKVETDEEEDEEELHLQLTDENINDYNQVQLLDLLEAAVAEPDLNAIKTRVAMIKMAFLKRRDELHLPEDSDEESGSATPANQEQEELNARFDTLFNIYKANKGRYMAEQEKIKKENLERKRQILEDLRNLVSSEETLKKTYDEFKILQDKWKEVGMVPRGEINDLWQNYHFLVEKFFEKVKLNKELKDLDLKKNLEAKIELCEKTEELLLEPSILKSFKQLQKYHDDWKEIGPTPTDKKDEVWERFKNATDKINERRREYYTSLEEEQNKNLETKNALCQQAEEVLTKRNETVKEWQDQTQKVNELLNLWKSVGPVPQKHNAAIWTQFKGCLDSFFASKKEFFDRVKDQQMHNFNLKVDLCVQAEAIKASTDWKKTTNELIHFQEEWKKIGPVPRKHSDKIWKRFRSACDDFFKAKSAYFANIHTHEDENLKAKEELLKKLKDHEFSDDKNKNLDDLKTFQREWTQIGHVPFKERDRLQNEFRKLVNEHLDKLKISEVEMTAISYQSKMESMKNDPQAKRIIIREKENLSLKISKLRDDINLWENNIGFLANSKNANILKAEFEKKIDQAKNELKMMEAKFKILRQQ